MHEPAPPGKLTALSTLIPGVVAAFLAADVVLRSALPEDMFTFRAWEPAQRDAPPGAPFGANFRYSNERAHGDLAEISNRRAHREVRSETFTTDAAGYRNPPDLLAAGPPGVLLFGDSFGAGCGVSDDETLAAHLGRITGRPAYNAATTIGGITSARIAEVRERTGMHGGVVVFEVLERRDSPPASEPPRTQPLKMPFIDEFARRSVVRKLSERVQHGLRDDVILPNPWAARAAVRTLRDGREMLFLVEENAPSAPGGPERYAATHLANMAREAAAAGDRVVVVLVPGKFTVYAPLFAADPLPRERLGARLRVVAESLRAAGIEVVDLTETMQCAAEAELAAGRLIYRADDTHWGPAGVRIAAERIAEAIAAPR